MGQVAEQSSTIDGSDYEFYMGVLAALDLLLLHDQPVIAGEIIRNVGPKELMAVAKKEEYAFMPQLKKVYRDEGIRG